MFQRLLLATLLWLLPSVGPAAERVLWQIGTPDRSYQEFALAGRHREYGARFAGHPLVFEIGRSTAAKDWPFIHPGPDDPWAGRRVHPWTIHFALAEEPRGLYILRLEFADVHKLNPPTYVVTVGGRSGSFRLPPGGGDETLTDPAAGKPYRLDLPLPADLFKKGSNDIVLACQKGSWVLYDAVTLLHDPDGRMPQAQVRNLTVRPTPFYSHQQGQVRRELDVAIDLTAPAGNVSLRVEANGQVQETVVNQVSLLGSLVQSALVPDQAGPMEVKVTATTGTSSKSVMARVEPQRKWLIFVAPSSHTDIGYTDVQPRCAERHNENTDAAIDLCRKFPDFCWNLEVAWQAENYVQSRKGERLKEFVRLAKEGRIGVQALYANMLTGLCSAEEACRLTQVAHDLHRQLGIPYRSAMISDVPSQEATLPMILANSGIRYFSSGINRDRAYPFDRMNHLSPAWWEGPDGSRVLMNWTAGYAQAARWGLDRDVEHARTQVLSALRGLEARADYPYDAVFLHGAVGDNRPLQASLATVAKAWNERYTYPKIVLSHNAAFFEHIEKHYGDKLPVVRGSGGTYWEDGAASSAAETAVSRRAHEATANAEKYLALAHRLEPKNTYPRAGLEKTWRECLLYDEHTWGAHSSISEPDSEFTKAQWNIRAKYAEDAGRLSDNLENQGLDAVAALVRSDKPALVVVNPCSWPRSDITVVKLPRGLTIGEPGAVVAELPDSSGERMLGVFVKDVPACGYRVLQVVPETKRSLPQPVEGTQIESRLYRVRFDPATGAIVSIVDKESGRELVDAGAPQRLNQYLYVSGGDGSRIVKQPPPTPPQLTLSSPEKAVLQRYRLGDLGEVMTLETSTAMTPKLTSTVTVWNDVKRIDISNRLTRTETYKKEGVYFAFPFAADAPTFRYEVPAGIVCANTDMLPGACLDWFTVQHFVEIADQHGAIAWATPDAPLACFQDINRGKWQTQLPFQNGHLYGYVMNNYWHTNYKAGQGGDFTFRFAITSSSKASNVAAARFGWGVSNPLVARPLPTRPDGALTAAAASLISIEEPNVILIGARLARDSEALVLRLWELSGKATTAHVRLAGRSAQKATACNLVEVPQGDLSLSDGAVAVPVRAFGLATVRIE